MSLWLLIWLSYVRDLNVKLLNMYLLLMLNLLKVLICFVLYDGTAYLLIKSERMVS